ncbi:MAG: 3-deoxy-D-manno-octulosonic acid transferase [Candidatus Omnitrophica bacterium]|nr:3-deoxy-D-manno-octulosonic acid transferase [Candidatus Omnitrophota bacterium]
MVIFYNFIFLIFSLIYLPHLLWTKKFHKGLWQRLGFYPACLNSTDSIWLHAVSVGEVVAIKPLWETLRKEFPSKRIVVSTITKTGNEIAKKFSKDKEAVFYLPLDLSFIINSVLCKIRPDILVIAETEIWPNLITCCHKRNIPMILVNGRVSDKAFKRYRLVKFALKTILGKIDSFCTRAKEDKERFVFLGAPPERVKVSGNMKYCDTSDNRDNSGAEGMKRTLGIKANAIIFTAGSTHKGEEQIILEVFKNLSRDFPDLHLIIIPRRTERAGEIKKLAAGFAVTVIDKFGILKELYGISDIVFVGGSLIRHGGHNIIEPALFGKPILFGPHMFNFKDVAGEFLKANAAIMVRDRDECEVNCRRLLKDVNERSRMGESAKKVVLRNQGAVENCIAELKKVLGNA